MSLDSSYSTAATWGRISSAKSPPFAFVAFSAVVASSSIVMFEPAPCDVLFVVGFLAVMMMGILEIPSRLNVGFGIGLSLLVVSNLVSLAVSHDVGLGVFFAAVTIYMFVFWLTTVSLIAKYGEAFCRWLITAYIIAALITAIVGLLARLDLVPNASIFMRDEAGTRVQSTFKDPNVFGPFLVAAVVLVLSEMVRRKRAGLMRTVCTVLLCCGIAITFSRGAMVHLAVSLFVFVALQTFFAGRHGAPIRLAKKVIPVTIAVLVVIGAMLHATNLSDYFQERIAYQSYDNTRFSEHRAVLAVAATHPLGIGPGQWNRHRFHQAVHNMYLRVWVENGIVGLIGLVLFLLTWWSTIWGRLRAAGPFLQYYIASASIVSGTLVEAIVIDTLHWRHFFLMLALPIGLAVHEMNRRDDVQALPKTMSDAGIGSAT